MANEPSYRCTKCFAHTDRELLTVKKVSFVEMGMGGRTLKSRVTDWLCPPCVAKDEIWNQEPFKAQPRKQVSRA